MEKSNIALHFKFHQQFLNNAIYVMNELIQFSQRDDKNWTIMKIMTKKFNYLCTD